MPFGPVTRPVFCSLALALALPLAACGQSSSDSSDSLPSPTPEPTPTLSAQPAGLVAESDTLHFTGTEPFWGGEVSGTSLTYSTPDNQQGTTIAVTRSATPDSVAFNGKLDGMPFALGVARGECSDGMSNRSYPFTATLEIGGELRQGCAWSQSHPFTPPDRP
jgi:uncharacterized membrane protein